jgi:hypothetical protein
MPSVKIAFGAGLATTFLAIGIVLTQSPSIVLARNGVSATKAFGDPNAGVIICQGDERLPRNTTAIMLSVGAFTGPKLSLEVFAGPRSVTSGSLGSGWAGQTVTVPVRPVSHAVARVRICFESSPLGSERTEVKGAHSKLRSSARTNFGKAVGGRVAITYLGAGHASWWTRISAVARRMGLGRAWSGTWITLLVAALMLIATALVARLALRELHE